MFSGCTKIEEKDPVELSEIAEDTSTNEIFADDTEKNEQESMQETQQEPLVSLNIEDY